MRSIGQAFAGRQPRQDDVFLDVEAAEDAPLLGHQLHASLGDDMRLPAGKVLAVEDDRTGARRNHAHQALQRGALARAVAAEQGHHLMRLDLEVDVEEDVRSRRSSCSAC